MSEINFIITQQEDLKKLLNDWLNDQLKSHSKPLSRAELADFLDVSTVTITEWVKKGLPHHRLYGRVYFLKEEVMAAMPTIIRNNQNNPS